MNQTITSPGFKLVMRHWTSGGTGITNFDKHELNNYQKALEKSKREDLIVCSVGFPVINKNSKLQGSLHGIGFEDTSSFFNELDKIKKLKIGS